MVIARPAVDLKKALRYLAETRDSTVLAVEGLSEEECCCKPDPGRWSIREIAEHLATVENLFLQNVAVNLGLAPPPPDDFDGEERDRFVLGLADDLATKFKAPERIAPTGAQTVAESLARFRAGRKQSIAFFETQGELREHALPHPMLGPLDGYQWALLMSVHTERHVRQMREIRGTQHNRE